ncbi:MAG: hypothetical protein IJ397_05850 [Lachnospiraceae bacterium]|nr:hypothetical protein [Lachnospiraceae bacterium]
MSVAFKELLIKQRENKKDKMLGTVMVVAAVLSLISGLILHPLFLLGAVAFGILSYVVYFRKMKVEYEYTYMDKELRIDRIYNESKRKSIVVLDLNKMEILAKENSYHLDSYKNRAVKEWDFSTGLEDDEELATYIMYYAGSDKYYLSLSEDFMKTIRQTMPHKVKAD